MEKYEYKFVYEKMRLAFDLDKKIDEVEQEWNELGQQGWRYCKECNGVIIFIRKIEG